MPLANAAKMGSATKPKCGVTKIKERHLSLQWQSNKGK
jgi:hypothetical protein